MGDPGDEHPLEQALVDPLLQSSTDVAGDDAAADDCAVAPTDAGGGDDHGGHGKGASVFATGLNMLNELEGAGILGLPYALRLCGWVSLLCLGGVGVLAGYTGYLLARCMHDPVTGLRVRSSYPAVGKAAFGRCGDRLVKVVQLGNLLSVGVVYLVLVGSSMEILLPLGLHASWLPLADRRMWTAAAAVVVLPTVHLGGYKKLAWMSALGLLCLSSALVLGFYDSVEQIASNRTYAHAAAVSAASEFGGVDGEAVSELLLLSASDGAYSFGPAAWPASLFGGGSSAGGGSSGSGTTSIGDLAADVAAAAAASADRRTRRQLTAEFPTWAEFDLGSLPAVVSIFVFAFSAHGIFPALEASMAEPRHFPKVVAVVFVTNITLKAAFAFTCYLAYGQLTQEVVAGNFQSWCSKVVSTLIVVNTCLSFPLPLVPVFKAFGIATALFRTLIVAGCCVIAVAVPNFALAMGFMGSLTLSCLTFVFPALFYLRIFGHQVGWGTKVLCGFVVVFGLVGLVAGLYSNVLLAIQSGQHPPGNNGTNATTGAPLLGYS